MQFLKKSKWYLLVASIVLVLTGLSLIIWTEPMKSLICFVIGGALIIFGLVKAVSYLVKRRANDELTKYDFAIGLFLLLVGLMFVLKPDSITSIMQTIVGFALLADAAIKLQFALDAYHMGASNWWVLLIIALVTAGMSVACIFAGAEILLTLIGVALLVEGVQNIATIIYVSKLFKVDNTTEVVYYKTDLGD